MLLEQAFEELENWIENENTDRRANGGPVLEGCEIQVLGQTALIEAKVQLHLLATKDVDAYVKGEQTIHREFDRILRKAGRELDSDSSLIWMPAETKYVQIFKGAYVKGSVAEPEYVLISKALKAPAKNRSLIQEYLAKGASRKFLDLAKRYKVDLEQFV